MPIGRRDFPGLVPDVFVRLHKRGPRGRIRDVLIVQQDHGVVDIGVPRFHDGAEVPVLQGDVEGEDVVPVFAAHLLTGWHVSARHPHVPQGGGDAFDLEQHTAGRVLCTAVGNSVVRGERLLAAFVIAVRDLDLLRRVNDAYHHI